MHLWVGDMALKAPPRLPPSLLPVSRRISGLLHGDYSGLLHRAGSEIGDTRRYLEGDDVRRIDWPATARTNETQVHDTIADHELEAWLVVDTSASMQFGTGSSTKAQLASDVAGAFGYLISHTGNRLGCITTALSGEAILPRSGTHQLAQVLGMLTNKRGDATTLTQALEKCLSASTRRGLVVVISDFFDESPWQNAMSQLAQKHDVIAVAVSDAREHEFQNVGVVEFQDNESGKTLRIDTSQKEWLSRFADSAQLRHQKISDDIRMARADGLSLRADQDWVSELALFLRTRKRRLAMGHRR